MATTIMALAKSITLALTAACGVNYPEETPPDALGVSTAPNPDLDPGPDDKKPPLEIQPGHMFCCNTTTSGSGEGCVLIGEQVANTCKSILYCDGPWHSNDGTVVCD